MVNNSEYNESYHRQTIYSISVQIIQFCRCMYIYSVDISSINWQHGDNMNIFIHQEIR